MIIDYVGVKEINGSLIVLDGVKGVSNEEIVDIRLDNGTVRQGRVVWSAFAGIETAEKLVIFKS